VRTAIVFSLSILHKGLCIKKLNETVLPRHIPVSIVKPLKAIDAGFGKTSGSLISRTTPNMKSCSHFPVRPKALSRGSTAGLLPLRIVMSVRQSARPSRHESHSAVRPSVCPAQRGYPLRLWLKWLVLMPIKDSLGFNNLGWSFTSRKFRFGATNTRP